MLKLPDGDLRFIVGGDHLQQLLGWNVSVGNGLRYLFGLCCGPLLGSWCDELLELR